MMESCALIEAQTAELHVAAQGYPYSGLNAIMALIEGFGFRVIGFNEWGEYIEV